MFKRVFFGLLAVLLAAVCFAGCGVSADRSAIGAPEISDNNGKISVVCTNFAGYDFVRQITGDLANLTLLLKPGAEAHSYEPTPKDVITIQNSRLFVYVGGDSDAWVDSILAGMDETNMNFLRMEDCVTLYEEETVEGMQAEHEEEHDDAEAGPEMDEHVWAAPANAMLIVQKLCDSLCEIDPDNADAYRANTTAYLAELTKLDDTLRGVIDSAARHEIIVADRFPFRYFTEEYGLDYYAAFPGCSSDAEASAATVAFLIDKVKEDEIPVVFHIELSNEDMCNSICEATGTKPALLHAVHNISDSDFKAGKTYLDFMYHNAEVLKEALN